MRLSSKAHSGKSAGWSLTSDLSLPLGFYIDKKSLCNNYAVKEKIKRSDFRYGPGPDMDLPKRLIKEAITAKLVTLDNVDKDSMIDFRQVNNGLSQNVPSEIKPLFKSGAFKGLKANFFGEGAKSFTEDFTTFFPNLKGKIQITLDNEAKVEVPAEITYTYRASRTGGIMDEKIIHAKMKIDDLADELAEASIQRLMDEYNREEDWNERVPMLGLRPLASAGIFNAD